MPGLPSRAFWRLTPLDDQAKLWTVRTTRAPLLCAAFMTAVIFELVQPLQPTVVEPSLLRFWRSPLAAAPTPKYATVDSFSQSSRVDGSVSSQ